MLTHSDATTTVISVLRKYSYNSITDTYVYAYRKHSMPVIPCLSYQHRKLFIVLWCLNLFLHHSHAEDTETELKTTAVLKCLIYNSQCVFVKNNWLTDNNYRHLINAVQLSSRQQATLEMHNHVQPRCYYLYLPTTMRTNIYHVNITDINFKQHCWIVIL